MSPSFISRVLSGKRRLSVQLADRIFEILNIPVGERDYATRLLMKDLKTSSAAKKAFRSDDYIYLSDDVFSVIADWYHFAITELSFLKGHKSDPRWISKVLGISLQEAREAMTRLVRLGLVELTSSGTFTKTKASLATGQDIPSQAIRSYHKQILFRAIESLHKHSVTERDISSVTMAIDPKKLSQAKAKIKVFRRSLSRFLERGERTKVYNLAVQLFPLYEESSKGK